MNFEGFVLATLKKIKKINIVHPSKFAQCCRIYVVEQNIHKSKTEALNSDGCKSGCLDVTPLPLCKHPKIQWLKAAFQALKL